MELTLKPWTVKQALPWVRQTHRVLKNIQGAMWAISVRNGEEVVGVALVGRPNRTWDDMTVLVVLRVAVLEGYPNACSMLYGACARAARAMGAENLVTYTHLWENGASLKASGWIDGGVTEGGEWGNEKRPRKKAVDAEPKRRWWAPWSKKARHVS